MPSDLLEKLTKKIRGSTHKPTKFEILQNELAQILQSSLDDYTKVLEYSRILKELINEANYMNEPSKISFYREQSTNPPLPPLPQTTQIQTTPIQVTPGGTPPHTPPIRITPSGAQFGSPFVTPSNFQPSDFAGFGGPSGTSPGPSGMQLGGLGAQLGSPLPTPLGLESILINSSSYNIGIHDSNIEISRYSIDEWLLSDRLLSMRQLELDLKKPGKVQIKITLEKQNEISMEELIDHINNLLNNEHTLNLYRFVLGSKHSDFGLWRYFKKDGDAPGGVDWKIVEFSPKLVDYFDLPHNILPIDDIFRILVNRNKRIKVAGTEEIIFTGIKNDKPMDVMSIGPFQRSYVPNAGRQTIQKFFDDLNTYLRNNPYTENLYFRIAENGYLSAFNHSSLDRVLTWDFIYISEGLFSLFQTKENKIKLNTYTVSHFANPKLEVDIPENQILVLNGTHVQLNLVQEAYQRLKIPLLNKKYTLKSTVEYLNQMFSENYNTAHIQFKLNKNKLSLDIQSKFKEAPNWSTIEFSDTLKALFNLHDQTYELHEIYNKTVPSRKEVFDGNGEYVELIGLLSKINVPTVDNFVLKAGNYSKDKFFSLYNQHLKSKLSTRHLKFRTTDRSLSLTIDNPVEYEAMENWEFIKVNPVIKNAFSLPSEVIRLDEFKNIPYINSDFHIATNMIWSLIGSQNRTILQNRKTGDQTESNVLYSSTKIRIQPSLYKTVRELVAALNIELKKNKDVNDLQFELNYGYTNISLNSEYTANRLWLKTELKISPGLAEILGFEKL
ncbi:unnamed protein product [Rotaria magnacalcarata]|uniref:Uncharacterized protein n=1 Tax=Rotaria magnacalcarata TaxID=392030 RepID=A0A816V4M7_9BILA|nr:unnamed protein product [Rotaria magnacalcarata]